MICLLNSGGNAKVVESDANYLHTRSCVTTMANMKFLKSIDQFDRCLAVGYKNFMINLILSNHLVTDKI